MKKLKKNIDDRVIESLPTGLMTPTEFSQAESRLWEAEAKAKEKSSSRGGVRLPSAKIKDIISAKDYDDYLGKVKYRPVDERTFNNIRSLSEVEQYEIIRKAEEREEKKRNKPKKAIR